jgi:SAM-dependent methyltransferase
MSLPELGAVRAFWEGSPLWTGESTHPEGSREFFEEHRSVVIDDCLAGSFDDRTLPRCARDEPVLDLGCGPGFWALDFTRRGFSRVHIADLTAHGLQLATQRFASYGLERPPAFQVNAERLPFADGSFAHVNCQGVVHHTPKTERACQEIARVLKPGGTASVSVYYRNAVLRAWKLLGPGASRLAAGLKIGLKGRGREDISSYDTVEEVVRRYDGADNPIGKSYSRRGANDLFQPYFHVDEVYLHFFPARALPFPIPHALHRLLDRRVGFLIYLNLTKR